MPLACSTSPSSMLAAAGLQAIFNVLVYYLLLYISLSQEHQACTCVSPTSFVTTWHAHVSYDSNELCICSPTCSLTC